MNLTQQQLNESDATNAGYETTQDIRASVYAKLDHEVAKLNRRADKLNVPHIVITKNREFDKTENDSNGMTRTVRYYEVTIDGDAPQVPGYDFLATIEHKDGGNIIRTVPGTDDSINFKDFHNATPDYCDHCKMRRKRIDTFIIRDRDGEMRQIGRNCLSDFLGGKNPKEMLFWFSLKGRVDTLMGNLSDEEGGGYGGHKSEYTVDPSTVLRVAGSLIKKYGYKKSNYGGYCDDDSTADMVRAVFFNYNHRNSDHKEYVNIAKNDKQVGEDYRDKAVAWFSKLSDDEKANNNFLHSVDVAINSSTASYRDVGYIGAIYPAYERAMGDAEKLKVQDKKSNDHIGTPGDKLNKTRVKVVKATYIPNRFAYGAPDNQLVKMEDSAGNSFTWFNSSRKTELEQDVTYDIMGKIKKHDDYRGRKTTVMTHIHAQEV